MFLSAGNRVHPHEDSGRCELALTNGWTAGQAVPEDRSPRSELGVWWNGGRCSGWGGSGVQRPSSLAIDKLQKYNQVLL